MSVELDELLERAELIRRSPPGPRGGQLLLWIRRAAVKAIIHHCSVERDELRQVFDALGIECSEKQMDRLIEDAEVEIEHLDEIALRMGLISDDPGEEPAMVQIARAAQQPEGLLYEEEMETTPMSRHVGFPKKFIQRWSHTHALVDTPPGTRVRVTVQKIEE